MNFKRVSHFLAAIPVRVLGLALTLLEMTLMLVTAILAGDKAAHAVNERMMEVIRPLWSWCDNY